MAKLSALLAVSIPILALPFWFFYYDVTPKLAALLTGVSVACWVVPGGPGWARRTRSERVVIVLLLLQVGLLAAAAAASTNPALSMSGGNWRRFGVVSQGALLLWLLLAVYARRFGDLLGDGVLRAIAISGTAISLYTIGQYFGFDPLLPSAAYHVGEGEWTIVRPPGTIGHADYLGCYLLFVVFLGGALVVREDGRVWRLVGFFAVVTGTIAIVLSGTRSAMLGLATGVVLLVVRQRFRVRQVVLATIASAIALGGFYYSPLGLKLRGRGRWVQEDPRGGARLFLWKDSLRMAAARPLLGWGPETFSAQFPRFQSEQLAAAYPDFYHESPHNIVVDELVSKGMPAAACFLVLCGLACVAAWRALGRRRDAPIGAALLASTVALQFNAFILVTAYFYAVAAVYLCCTRDALPPAAGLRPKWQWAAAAVLTAGFGVFTVCLCTADILLHRVQGLVEMGDVVGAAQTYEKVRRWQPPGVNSDLYYSRAMHRNVRKQTDLLYAVKAWQETVQAAIRAAQFGEEPHNAQYQLAILYGSVNDPRDAESSLRAAIAAAPKWFKPHWILAQVLERTGRRVEAEVEAAAAVALSGGKLSEVNESLQSLLPQRK